MRVYGKRGAATPGVVAAWALATGVAAAEPAAGSTSPAKHFDGFYVGIEFGRQSVIGGSLVDGVDTLQQESRGVVSFPIGWRKQVGDFVLGAEFSYGLADADLRLVDPEGGLRIDYANDSQSQIGGMLGYTLGARRTGLLFAYLGEVSRSFDVTIRQGDHVTRQDDEQGLLRYGVGAEWVVWQGLRVRATFGTSRAKFERTTNIEPERPLDASIGLVFQL